MWILLIKSAFNCNNDKKVLNYIFKSKFRQDFFFHLSLSLYFFILPIYFPAIFSYLPEKNLIIPTEEILNKVSRWQYQSTQLVLKLYRDVRRVERGGKLASPMRSCVSSACAIQVRVSCVRCLDSLCHSWHTKNRSTLHIYGPKSVLISSKLAYQASYFFFGEYWIMFLLFLDITCSVIGEISIRMRAMCPQFLQYFTYLSCLPLLTSGDRRRQQTLQNLLNFVWFLNGVMVLLQWLLSVSKCVYWSQ